VMTGTQVQPTAVARVASLRLAMNAQLQMFFVISFAQMGKLTQERSATTVTSLGTLLMAAVLRVRLILVGAAQVQQELVVIAPY
jgi:hypothetical protein